MFLLCCQPRRKAPAGASPLPGAGAGAAAALEVGTPKSGAQRILQPKSSAADLEVPGEPSRSSRSLLEASARRVALSSASGKELLAGGGDSGAPLAFVQLYMAAIKDRNAGWASDPAVGDLFTEDAVLVTPEKKTFSGKAALLKRLGTGMEMLIKLAGGDAELPAFELTGPTPMPGDAVQLLFTIQRGRQALKFRLEFTLQGGKIALLRNSRA